MAKFFNIITSTTDPDGNSSQENVQVKAGQAFAEIPQVSFQFPSVISTQIGDSSNPFWSSSFSRGFAFIGVTPSPSDAGTGGFFVQTYYNSGEYPQNPSRQFKDTAKGDGTTLAADWFFSTSLMSVTAGGFTTSGFFSQTDLSGLRPALIISRDTQEDTPTFDDGIRRVKPGRRGARVPVTDSIIIGYHHDQGTDPDELRTLKIVQDGEIQADEIEGTGSDAIDRGGSGVPRSSAGWPAGTFIFPHPYHYVPVYENNNIISKNVLPYVLIVEDGTQYPLRGTVSVSGTSVTGTLTAFDSEISGQSVIRFEGDTNWYIISGTPASSSGLTIYDYGENPSFTNVAVEANRYAIGSGLIEVLPNLAGCSSWGVTLTPKYDDGDIIPGDSIVYTAAFTGTGAISGTPSYQWTVAEQLLTGGTITTSGTGNISASTLEVIYDETKKFNVSVTVSGSAQPACIHSFETGFLNLKPGANAGTWSVNLRAAVNEDGENISDCRWFRRGTPGPATDFIHHWQSLVSPPAAVAASAWGHNVFTLTMTSISDMDQWPDQGTAIIYVRRKVDDGSGIARFGFCHLVTYTGKTSSSLTGLNSANVRVWSVTDNGITIPRFIGAFSYDPSIYNITAYLYTPAHWPMTWITGIDSSRTRVKVEDIRRIKEVRAAGGIQKFWVLASQHEGFNIDPIGVFSLNGFSFTTDELEFTTPVPTTFKIGDPIFPGFWDHWRQGASSRLDPGVSSNQWNAFNQCCLMVRGAHNRSDDSFTSADVLNSSPAFEFDSSDTLRIVIFNFIIGALSNDSIYGASISNGTLSPIMIPEKGKIVIVNQDRTKNLVFEYDGITRFFSAVSGPSGSGSEHGATLLNCRLVENRSGINAITAADKVQFRRGAMAFFYKELSTTGEHVIETQSGDDPHIEISLPGHIEAISYANSTWYDLIQANTTENDAVGIIGTPKAGNIWEDRVPDWPVGAMAQIDSIYTSLPDQLPPPPLTDTDPFNTGSCIEENEIVRIEGHGRMAIGDVEKGDMILGHYMGEDSWFKVSSARHAIERNGGIKFTFSNNETVICTGEHPFAKLYKSGIRWTKAKNIKLGDTIQALRHYITVRKIDEVEGPIKVVDLTVSKAKTFYVGKVLVHNKRKDNIDL